jgi:hypothetical protein
VNYPIGDNTHATGAEGTPNTFEAKPGLLLKELVREVHA